MNETAYPFQDSNLDISERVDDLLSQLTVEEKIGQLCHSSPAIERLGIAAYSWWNECLHGVARAGVATVFPQAIGLAATFNHNLLSRVFSAVADEARAKHHAALSRGDHGIYRGLTYWSPNINIFRDPRWGRGQETFGECPWLTADLAKAAVRSMQEAQGGYLKLVATPKHFAVHSGPEAERHGFDATVSEKDLFETYLPAFRACVIEARAHAVMTAYNRTNGEACSASPTLIEDILRGRWHFRGHVVSDCGAIKDIHEGHELATSMAEAAAIALRAGCDLNCGCAYQHLNEAIEEGLVTEEEIDRSLRRLLEARFHLGMFDPPEKVPFASIPFEIVDCPDHRMLALEAARQSIILLKNEQDFLPLPDSLGSIAVIGPNADNREVLLGNYNGLPSQSTTPLEGIRRRVSEKTHIVYQPGCEHIGLEHPLDRPDRYFAEAAIAADAADVVILCLGLGPALEGEEGDHYPWGASGDRTTLELPEIQCQLLDLILSTGTPVVLVLMSGSPISLGTRQEGITSIVQQFYPGQDGGTALAEALFGDFSPAGRLPVTVHHSIKDLPPFGDYSMEGRTYRYFGGEPEYPFGFGLGYTRFGYANLQVDSDEYPMGLPVSLSVEVHNQGEVAGDEVVQVYLSREGLPSPAPIRQLAGARRIHLLPGEKRVVEFTLEPRQLAVVEESGRTVLLPGTIHLDAGGSQPDPVSQRLGAAPTVHASFELVGERRPLPD